MTTQIYYDNVAQSAKKNLNINFPKIKYNNQHKTVMTKAVSYAY